MAPETYFVATVICGQCSGSGEGMWDGSRCTQCEGSGEVPSEDEDEEDNE